MHPAWKAAAAALLLAGAVAPTESAAADNLPRVHDRGLFIRMSAGAGTASSSYNPLDGGSEIDWSGATGDVNFAIGAVVGRNLAVHATSWGWSMFDASPEQDGTDWEEVGNTSYSVRAVGAGVTWYTNSNWYLSGSLGAAMAEIDFEVGGADYSVESDTGFALDATIGREWWVGDTWGLGAAAGFGYHSLPDEGIDGDITGTSIALRFSATYN